MTSQRWSAGDTSNQEPESKQQSNNKRGRDEKENKHTPMRIALNTAEVTTKSKVLCCSLNASLIPLAIASSRSSLEMVESFLLWRLLNLSFPIAPDCWNTHDGSNAEWSEIYWQDNIILTKWAERKTMRASLSKGHVIPPTVLILDHLSVHTHIDHGQTFLKTHAWNAFMHRCDLCPFHFLQCCTFCPHICMK